MRYPWFVGAALWAGWLISLIAGRGNTDLAGHLIGTDFVAFYTAGKIVLMGRSSDLYNQSLALSIQQGLYGGTSLNYNPYLNPPHFALFMAPFALIPYPWAPVIWIGLGLICLWLSMKLLGADHPTRYFFMALTWLPVFDAASFGQNSFISLALLSLTFFLWIRKRYLPAGLVFSLLLYKPQFLIGIGLLWLLDWRKSWKALLGLGLGIIIQIGLNIWLFPKASLAYLTYAIKINSNLMSLKGFPIWNAFSVQAFWLALFPGIKWLIQSLYILCVLFSLYYFLIFWKKNSTNREILYSAAIIWLVWSIPYIMIYDWTLLLIPAVLLWRYCADLKPLWKVLYAFLWVVTLISSPLTFLQSKLLPFALQISIPALLLTMVIGYKELNKLFPPKKEQAESLANFS